MISSAEETKGARRRCDATPDTPIPLISRSDAEDEDRTIGCEGCAPFALRSAVGAGATL